MAAQKYEMDKSIIDLLIAKGVDVTCQDKVTYFSCNLKSIHKREFQDGKTPHQVAVDGETRRLLRQRYVRHHFDLVPVCSECNRTPPDFPFFIEKWFVRIR